MFDFCPLAIASRLSLLWWVVAIVLPNHARAESQAILQLRPDGPSAPIHALSFSRDGEQLYAAGDEKLVQVWQRKDGRFHREHADSLRHAIGPGPLGTMYCMAVSDDDRYIATGGIGTFANQSGFSDKGILIPSFSWTAETLDQIGTVTLFDRREHTTAAIKTHPGYVLAMAMVTLPEPATTYLVTIGNDQHPADCNHDLQGMNASVHRSLRVFNVPDGKLLKRWELPATEITPKLIGWTTPSATDITGLRVAVTLAEGTAGGGVDLFRGDRDQPHRLTDPLALAADRMAQTDSLCVASSRSLKIFDTTSGTLTRTINLQNSIGKGEYIFSLVMIPSDPSLVAITVRNIEQRGSVHRLQLVDITSGQTLLRSAIPLGNAQNPVLAVDARGRFLAATANAAAGVKIFELDRLRRGDLQPLQNLVADFQRIRRAVITVGEGAPILRVELAGGENAEVLDLDDRVLKTASREVWTSFDKQLAFKQVGTQNEFVARVSSQGALLGQIKVASNLPPLGKVLRSKVLQGRPLAAVAFLQHTGEGQPQLSLYDPISGDELRRLSGHQQLITSIEFSADHRFLTSVSAEGMVCVWALDDLVDLVDRRGAIGQVRWCRVDGAIVVSAIDPDAAANGLLVGDKILGLVRDGEPLQTFDSPETLFQTLSYLPPKSAAVLRVQRGSVAQNVTVRLGHAADERKPLFSFISKRASDAKPLDWLVWTPLGPFQSSGPELEQRAGWHFNPEQPGGNARFAPFSEYRDQFSGDGLLGELLALGRLPDVWPPAVDARLVARVVDADDQSIPDQAGQFISDAEMKRIEIAISNVPAQYVDGFSARLDNSEDLIFSPSDNDPDIWVGQLPERILPGIQHEISVSLHSDRITDGVQHESWSMSIQPLPLPRAGEERELPEVESPKLASREPLPRQITPPTASPTEIPVPQVPLPSLRITSPGVRSTVKLIDLGEARLPITAVVDAAKLPAGATLVAFRNAEPIEIEDLSMTASNISGSIPLVLGANRLSLQLKRDVEVVSSPAISIELIDPSFIESVVADVDVKNGVHLQLVVYDASLPKESNFHTARGGDKSNLWAFDAPPQLISPKRYRLRLSGLVLSPGPNRVPIDMVNANGQRIDSKPLLLAGRTLAKQPQVELLTSEGDVVDSSTTAVIIRVTSDDLKQVRCVVAGVNIPVELSEADSKGIREIQLRVPIQLGLNRIAVSAISEAGLIARDSCVVSRIQRPVELIVERFVGENAQVVALAETASGNLESSTMADTARGTLEGYVRVTGNVNELRKGAKSIRAWVNGFLQSVVKLKEGRTPHELRFRIPVLLALKENNVTLDLPGLVESENTLVKAVVRCAEPSRDQTLHLLVVSTRVSFQQRQEFEKRVLDLFGVRDGKMPAFSQVISGSPDYPALTGAISRSDSMRSLIDECRFKLSAEQGKNNAVLIYFHGEELRSPDGRSCLLTVDADPEKAFSDSNLITSTFLGSQFEGLKCANLIFLDVTPHVLSASPTVAGDPSEPGLGILRMLREGQTRQSTSPLLLEQVRQLLPGVSDLAELTEALEALNQQRSQLAISDSIPDSVLTMPFGERVTE